MKVKLIELSKSEINLIERALVHEKLSRHEKVIRERISGKLNSLK